MDRPDDDVREGRDISAGPPSETLKLDRTVFFPYVSKQKTRLIVKRIFIQVKKIQDEFINRL